MPTDHIAIVAHPIAAALHAGRKTIESRFLQTRRPPYNRIRPGDRLHFKPVGRPLALTAPVARVLQFDQLTPAKVRTLRDRYHRQICADPTYWRHHRTARYAVLIWISPPIPAPANLHVPRQYGNAWICLPP